MKYAITFEVLNQDGKWIGDSLGCSESKEDACAKARELSKRDDIREINVCENPDGFGVDLIPIASSEWR